MYSINTSVSKDLMIKLMLSTIIGISLLDVIKVKVDDIILDDNEKDVDHMDKMYRAERFDEGYKAVSKMSNEDFDLWKEAHECDINLDLALK